MGLLFSWACHWPPCHHVFVVTMFNFRPPFFRNFFSPLLQIYCSAIFCFFPPCWINKKGGVTSNRFGRIYIHETKGDIKSLIKARRRISQVLLYPKNKKKDYIEYRSYIGPRCPSYKMRFWRIQVNSTSFFFNIIHIF